MEQCLLNSRTLENESYSKKLKFCVCALWLIALMATMEFMTIEDNLSLLMDDWLLE